MEYLDKSTMTDMKKRYDVRTKAYEKELKQQTSRQSNKCPVCWERFKFGELIDNPPVLADLDFDLEHTVRCAVHDKCKSGNPSN